MKFLEKERKHEIQIWIRKNEWEPLLRYFGLKMEEIQQPIHQSLIPGKVWFSEIESLKLDILVQIQSDFAEAHVIFVPQTTNITLRFDSIRVPVFMENFDMFLFGSMKTINMKNDEHTGVFDIYWMDLRCIN